MATKPLAYDDVNHILLHTGPLWEEARGRRIFITGGTGFFGCWLLESLLHVNRVLGLDIRVTALSRSPGAFVRKCPHLVSNPAVTLHAGDVRSFVFPKGEFHYVIHAATEASARQIAEAPLEMLSTILVGTERALQFAASHGAQKFLFTSSGAVYGKQPSDLTHISESYLGAPDPLDPSSVYGEGKRAAEQMCVLHTAGTRLECKIARCFAFVGPHLPLDAHFAIGNFIRDAMLGGPIMVKGDGMPLRSYLYAADLALWLWTILLDAPAGRAYNVGSDHAVSIQELASEVAAALDPAIEVRLSQKPSPGVPAPQYVPSVRRAREELGLEVHVNLGEAIRRTALWHGFQPK